MAKVELFQAVLNKLLSDIRDDALECFHKSPIENIEDIPDDEIEKQALEDHQKGFTGRYLYYITILQLRYHKRKLDN
jgi:hypothetical protein